MHVTLELSGEKITAKHIHRDDLQSIDIHLTAEDTKNMRSWSSRYQSAVSDNQNHKLLSLGQEIYSWLNTNSLWLSTALSEQGDRVLEVCVQSVNSETAQEFLELPWELLVETDGSFLAENKNQLFQIIRRIGKQTSIPEPVSPNLSVLFTSAMPLGQGSLNFELEEIAILESTRNLKLFMAVEETGNLQELGKRYRGQSVFFQAVHISSHGDIDNAHGPFLAMEQEDRSLDMVTPDMLLNELGEDADKPPLVFVSACKTAESNNHFVASYSRTLVASGIANVLGFRGSVRDTDARDFAEYFYNELVLGRTPSWSLAKARHLLRIDNIKNPQKAVHWHLARLYCGIRGNGKLCNPKLAGTALPQRDGAFKTIIDHKAGSPRVPTTETYVSRRKELSEVLTAFRNNTSDGVIILGTGAIGKTSLAARIAHRLDQQFVMVFVFGDYSAQAIFIKLLDAVPVEQRQEVKTQWLSLIEKNPTYLALALECMLLQHFSSKPALLIIDDLERILTVPTQSNIATIRQADSQPDIWKVSITAVLETFHKHRGDSRLLFTSRYPFSLPNNAGRDIAKNLLPVYPTEFTDQQKMMQWLLAEQQVDLRQLSDPQRKERVEQITSRLKKVFIYARNNPGLQDLLITPLLQATPEYDVVDRAIEQIQNRDFGENTDTTTDISDFFRRLSFQVYIDALDVDEQAHLKTLTLFPSNLPIPRSILTKAGEVAGANHPEKSLARLEHFGLVTANDPLDVALHGTPHATYNQLISQLLCAEPDQHQLDMLAETITVPLWKIWGKVENPFPAAGRQFVLLVELALQLKTLPTFTTRASLLADEYLKTIHDTHGAFSLLKQTIATLRQQQQTITPALLLRAIDYAETLGKQESLDDLLKLADSEIPLTDAYQTGSLLLRKARIMKNHGQISIAEKQLQQALQHFHTGNHSREVAIVSGQIADILQQRGQLDKALLIRENEEIPVYEKLGDIRSLAVTKGQIADILQQRGQLDKALLIRENEEIPVYEKLGDIRSLAVTKGQIADILQQRGQLDKALLIRENEQIPVYEKLGDIRSLAVTKGKIADILQQRGQLDKALLIRENEEIPVYEKLGDIRSLAVTKGQIADILQQRGQLDKALLIRENEQIPVYEKLGDIRSLAVTKGKIADILQQRGQLDTALNIWQNELLPLAERHVFPDILLACKHRSAKIRLAADDISQEIMTTAMTELTEALAIAKKLDSWNAMVAVGLDLSQILFAVGAEQEAQTLFSQCLEKLEAVGLSDQADAIRKQYPQLV